MSSLASRLRPARAFAAALLVAAATLASGCGDGGGPVGLTPVIAGHWSGTAKAYTVHFSATFTETAGAVGGTGSFTSPLGGGDFTVSGTLAGRDVSLVLTSADLGATTFQGRFTAADRIEGTLDLGGSSMDLTLNRD